MTRVLIALMLAAVTATVIAEPSGLMVYGPVKESCGAYTRASATNQTTFEFWAYGFVSGAARELALRDVRITATDTKGIDAWLSKYCAEHPLETFISATMHLVDELNQSSVPLK